MDKENILEMSVKEFIEQVPKTPRTLRGVGRYFKSISSEIMREKKGYLDSFKFFEDVKVKEVVEFPLEKLEGIRNIAEKTVDTVTQYLKENYDITLGT